MNVVEILPITKEARKSIDLGIYPSVSVWSV
jgi:hypothetical protein